MRLKKAHEFIFQTHFCCCARENLRRISQQGRTIIDSVEFFFPLMFLLQSSSFLQRSQQLHNLTLLKPVSRSPGHQWDCSTFLSSSATERWYLCFLLVYTFFILTKVWISAKAFLSCFLFFGVEERTKLGWSVSQLLLFPDTKPTSTNLLFSSHKHESGTREVFFFEEWDWQQGRSITPCNEIHTFLVNQTQQSMTAPTDASLDTGKYRWQTTMARDVRSELKHYKLRPCLTLVFSIRGQRKGARRKQRGINANSRY